MSEINWVTTARGEIGCIEIGRYVTTLGPDGLPCSGGDCVEIAPIGQDWFRIRSNLNPHQMVAVTGAELRAFLRQAKVGQFDELAGLPPDTTAADLQAENADLRGRLDELERFAEVTTVVLSAAS